MTQLKMRHINAVTRAQNLLETGIDVTDNAKLRRSIEKDIATLSELRDLLYYAIENPALPFLDDVNEPADPILNQIDEEPDGSF